MENNIRCIEVIGRKIIIHLKDGDREDSLLHQLEYILGFCGYEQLNRNKLVNMSAVESYDPNIDVIYYDKEKTSFCQVSRSNRHKLRKYPYLFDK